MDVFGRTEDQRRSLLENIAYAREADREDLTVEAVAEEALLLMDERDELAAMASRFIEFAGFNFRDSNGRSVRFGYDAMLLHEAFLALDEALRAYGCPPREPAGTWM